MNTVLALSHSHLVAYLVTKMIRDSLHLVCEEYVPELLKYSLCPRFPVDLVTALLHVVVIVERRKEWWTRGAALRCTGSGS